MFDEIEQIRRMRKKYNLHMFHSGIDTFREPEELEGNAIRDGVLNQKYKEFMALGISINQSCYGRIAYHVSQAADWEQLVRRYLKPQH